MPTNWLKIPKSVNVTNFPFGQLFKYLLYLAEMCCDSKDEVLVDERSWSRSCCLAVGVVGVIGTFSLPLACVIPRADSHIIICTVRQRHRYKSGSFLAVMAGDCGDEIPSKSKPQSAGVTSCANFENVLHVRCLQTSIFRLRCRSFRSEYTVLLHFPRILRIFFEFTVQTLHSSNHET